LQIVENVLGFSWCSQRFPQNNHDRDEIKAYGRKQLKRTNAKESEVQVRMNKNSNTDVKL